MHHIRIARCGFGSTNRHSESSTNQGGSLSTSNMPTHLTVYNDEQAKLAEENDNLDTRLKDDDFLLEMAFETANT